MPAGTSAAPTAHMHRPPPRESHALSTSYIPQLQRHLVRFMWSAQVNEDMFSLSIEQLFGVRGYVAVVTGGTSGLGFMISKVSNNERTVRKKMKARIDAPFLLLIILPQEEYSLTKL